MIRTPHDWLDKAYIQLFCGAVIIIGDGGCLRIVARLTNQPNRSKLSLHKPLLSF